MISKPPHPIARTASFSGGDPQLLDTHLRNVGEGAALRTLKVFGLRGPGEYLGLRHDLFKLREGWDLAVLKGDKPDPHSPGAAVLVMSEHVNNALAAWLVAGHHSGLKDRETFRQAIRRYQVDTSPQDLELAQKFLKTLPHSEFQVPEIFKDKDPFLILLALRLIFSCLVDADGEDAHRFHSPKAPFGALNQLPLQEYLTKALDRLKLEKEKQTKARNPAQLILYEHRTEAALEALRAAMGAPGFYHLTLPTGMGKTLIGLLFSLKHMLTHQKEGVIYIVPYLSLAEQQTQFFRGLFGAENMLNHTSSGWFSEEDWEGTSEVLKNKLRTAAHNWDARFILSTHVQFFETLMSNRVYRLRKLHNFVNKVILVEEPQTLPSDLLESTLRTLKVLVEHFGCTVVFATATQPAFSKQLLGAECDFALDTVKPVITDYLKYYAVLPKVQFRDLGEVTPKSLASRILESRQVLVLLNTIKRCQVVLAELEGQEHIYHISSRMCPIHKKEVLIEVFKRLGLGLPVKLIATRSSEHGLNMDFPEIYKEWAGLPSLTQSRGRCNREGLLGYGVVNLFTLEMPPDAVKISKGEGEVALEITQRLVAQYGLNSIGAPFLTNLFYQDLYATVNLDRVPTDPQTGAKARASLCGLTRQWALAQIGAGYRVVSSSKKPVLIQIQCPRIKELLEKIEARGWEAKDILFLQSYTVELWESDYIAAIEAGHAVESVPNAPKLWIGPYTDLRGLILPSEHTETII